MIQTWRGFFILVILLGLSGRAATDPKTDPKTDSGKKEAGLPRITNLKQIAKELRLERFDKKKFNRKIKVAIMDNGFVGYKAEIGKTLPKSTEYHAGPETQADTVVNTENHGTLMASVVSQIIKQSGVDADYELHLYYTQGFTKFQHAIKEVATKNFDLVLHSQVWEYAGNGDGKGFVNVAVNEATQAGVLWINAAGDFGRLTYQGGIETAGDWVRLSQRKSKSGKKKGEDATTDVEREDANAIRVRCEAPQGSSCVLRLVLSWNDFKDDADLGTEKDLDLFLCSSVKGCDPRLKKNSILGKSTLVQKLKEEKGASLYPRELITFPLAAGEYFVRVKNQSKNFDADSRLRIMASGPGIAMVDYMEGETLLPPADHPDAIVVGASDQMQSSRSDRLKRPDVSIKSLLRFAKPLVVAGAPENASVELPSTSVAAALLAGLSVLHLGTDTEKKRESLVTALKAVHVDPSPLLAQQILAENAKRRKKPSQIVSRPVTNSPGSSAAHPPQVQAPQFQDSWQSQPPLQSQSRAVDPGGPCAVPAPLPQSRFGAESHHGAALVLQIDSRAGSVFVAGRFALITTIDYRPLYRLRLDEYLVATPNQLQVWTIAQMQERGLPPNHYVIYPVMQIQICR